MRRLLPLVLALVALSSAGAEAAFHRCVGDRCVYYRGGVTWCVYDSSPYGYSELCAP